MKQKDAPSGELVRVTRVPSDPRAAVLESMLVQAHRIDVTRGRGGDGIFARGLEANMLGAIGSGLTKVELCKYLIDHVHGGYESQEVRILVAAWNSARPDDSINREFYRAISRGEEIDAGAKGDVSVVKKRVGSEIGAVLRESGEG